MAYRHTQQPAHNNAPQTATMTSLSATPKERGNASDKIVGRTLGEFMVTRVLGHGGFGAVYLAHQESLGRDAVIKVPHDGRIKRKNEVDRFLREATLASRLDHPYAAHIYSFGDRATDTFELPGLQHPQQLGLDIQRELAHLVEEQRAAISRLEPTALSRHGAGEGPLLAAE